MTTIPPMSKNFHNGSSNFCKISDKLPGLSVFACWEGCDSCDYCDAVFAFRYDCILPHGLKFWSRMFNVEVVSTNELLDALDRYIKDDVGLTQRGLFWKVDQSNENVAKTDRIFNQLARREIKDWIAYWVHRRASE